MLIKSISVDTYSQKTQISDPIDKFPYDLFIIKFNYGFKYLYVLMGKIWLSIYYYLLMVLFIWFYDLSISSFNITKMIWNINDKKCIIFLKRLIW